MITLLLGLALAAPQDDFAAANAALAAGDLTAAEAGYRGLLAQGVTDGDVYYNLGNVLFRQGRRAGAVLAWRHARLVAPRDADAAANLEFARREGRDRLLAPERRPGFAPWQAALTAAEGQWLGCLALGLGLGALALRGRAPRLPATGVGLTLAVAGAWVWAGGWAEAVQPPVAVVLAESVTATSDLGGGVDIFALHAGAEVQTVDEEAGFVLVLLPDGRKG